MEAWIKFLEETFTSMTIDKIQIMLAPLFANITHIPSEKHSEKEGY